MIRAAMAIVGAVLMVTGGGAFAVLAMSAPCAPAYGCYPPASQAQAPASSTVSTSSRTSLSTSAVGSSSSSSRTSTYRPPVCGVSGFQGGCQLYPVGFKVTSDVDGSGVPALLTVTNSAGRPSLSDIGGYADASGNLSTVQYAGTYTVKACFTGFACQTERFTVPGASVVQVPMAPLAGAVYPYGLPQTLRSSGLGVDVTWTLLKATEAACVLASCGSSTSHLMTLYSPSPPVAYCGTTSQGVCVEVSSQKCYQFAQDGSVSGCWATLMPWGSGYGADPSGLEYVSAGYYPVGGVVASFFQLTGASGGYSPSLSQARSLGLPVSGVVFVFGAAVLGVSLLEMGAPSDRGGRRRPHA